MAFDLKTATPDTSFPANGFLFGADSQSATDPSIYSHTAYLNYILNLANTWTATQTITPAANTNALAVTGYSLTGANTQSLIDLAGTWNTSGAPIALKLDITNTSSPIGSKLADLAVGGASMFSVRRDGYVVCANGFSTQNIGIGDAGVGTIRVISNSGYLVFGASVDTFILRDAANTIALRNSTTAQTFRVYETYTDASNYERATLSCASNTVTLAAETAGTGADDMDVALTPAGTGNVKFGTHSAVAAETVTGYITIKDAGGTLRKIAVIS